MKKVILFLLFLNISWIYSQKDNYNWYFGYNAGITFNTPNNIPVALTDGQLSTWEGCASISDGNGNLLFYSDGSKVWNRNHTIMPNGSGLQGHNSSTQSAIIVKKPGSVTQYYLFTMDAGENNGVYGLSYNIIDMTLDGGNGSVVIKNEILLPNIMEKLTAAYHRNGTDYWIICYHHIEKCFYSYLLTKNGIGSAVKSPIGSQIKDGSGNYIKISPKCDKLVSSMRNGEFFLLDFDNSTGKLSNPFILKGINSQWIYCVEFSPDATKLYGSTINPAYLYQFDLNEGTPDNIISKAVILAGAPNNNFYYWGGLQNGPDGKLYTAILDQFDIGVVNYPNIKGKACGYVEKAVNLGGKVCGLGIPNFYSSCSIEPGKDTCDGNSFYYRNFDSTANLNFVGNGYRNNNFIRLTSAKVNETGAVWYNKKLPLTDGFTTKFKFRMSEGSNNSCSDISQPGADGIAFVIQNTNPFAIGMNGGGIGYESILNCLAVEFDTFSNDSTQIENYFDPNGNHIAVQTNLSAQIKAKHESRYTIGLTSNIPAIQNNGTIYYVKIDYNIEPGKLRIYMSDDSLTAYLNPLLEIDNLDLSKLVNLTDGSLAYLGLTSATGCAVENHDILSWEVCTIGKTTDIYESNTMSNPELDFTLYPNPSSSLTDVNINGEPGQEYVLRILNIQGEIIYQTQGTIDNYGFKTVIDLSSYPTGCYNMVINTGGQIKSGRLIKFD